MVKPFSGELKQQWKDKILEQRSSGISIPVWCRQNSIPIYSFRYWQSKLFPDIFLNRSSFTEIHSRNGEIGIFLEYQGIRIYLSKHFDVATLKRCLEVIKRC